LNREEEKKDTKKKVLSFGITLRYMYSASFEF